MCRATSAVALNISKLKPRGVRRRGLTLVELLVSMAVTGILAATLGVLADSVSQTAKFDGGQTDALQHAQVVIDRIERMVNEAYATETYPGVVVVDETVGSYRYPDTVVIWKPTGTPVNPAGPPLVRELVIICPSPTNAGELIEVTALNDSRTIALNEASLNTASGRTLINGIKTASTSSKVQLTPLLRSASTAGTSGTSSLRGCVRFECELHPTAAEMSAFRGGTKAWDTLGWSQGLFSSTYGTRQVWLRMELQLLSEPRDADGAVSPTASTLPFFGSSAIYYAIPR
jgi:prepilin-type N-terminal cleavage/methylation domain-containing protein